MSTVLVTMALLALACALVWFALRAKDLRIGHQMQAWEDDEQMRIVSTSGGSGADVVATLH